MIKAIRLVGSSAFVLGLFTVVFAGIPWLVTTVDEPTLGGPLPPWLVWAVYLFLGGVIVVLVSVVAEQFLWKSQAEEDEEEPEDASGILVGNASRVAGREVTETLGLVQGHTIYAIWLGNDISALVRLILGGELTEYTQMMGRARTIALRRMRAQARSLEADAIIDVRLTTTSVVGTAAELLAYGTAVKLASPSA